MFKRILKSYLNLLGEKFALHGSQDQDMFVTIWKLLFCLIQNNMVPILKACSDKKELLTW